MNNTYTNKRKRGRPVTVTNIEAEEVNESITDVLVDDSEVLTLQQRAINSIENLGDVPSGCERWAMAYKQAGSVLMHQ